MGILPWTIGRPSFDDIYMISNLYVSSGLILVALVPFYLAFDLFECLTIWTIFSHRTEIPQFILIQCPLALGTQLEG